MAELWLVRHGETEWSLSGAHTGRTDIPLTARGEEQARALGGVLDPARFAVVLTSPLQRARLTADLAGLGAAAEIDPNLMEWNYGDYEGRTTAQIRADDPEWTIWDGQVPRGETIVQVAARADRVIERAAGVNGDVAIFGHGHMLRILAARWLTLPPDNGRLLALDTASLSRLGYERDARVVRHWNVCVKL